MIFNSRPYHSPNFGRELNYHSQGNNVGTTRWCVAPNFGHELNSGVGPRLGSEHEEEDACNHVVVLETRSAGLDDVVKRVTMESKSVCDTRLRIFECFNAVSASLLTDGARESLNEAFALWNADMLAREVTWTAIQEDLSISHSELHRTLDSLRLHLKGASCARHYARQNGNGSWEEEEEMDERHEDLGGHGPRQVGPCSL